MEALAPTGSLISTEPNFTSSSITTTGPAKRALVRSSSIEPSRRTSASRVGTVHSPRRFSEPAQPRSSTRSVADVTIAPGPGRSPTSPSRSVRVRACETSDERCSNSPMSISPSATALCSRRMVPLRSASEIRNATMSSFESIVRPTLAIYRCRRRMAVRRLYAR